MPDKKALDAKQRKQLLEWIDKHPGMLEHLAELKEIGEAGPEHFNDLGQAESSVIEQVNALGAEVLGQWAQEKQQQAGERELQEKRTRLHKKKASRSRPSSEP